MVFRIKKNSNFFQDFAVHSFLGPVKYGIVGLRGVNSLEGQLTISMGIGWCD